MLIPTAPTTSASVLLNRLQARARVRHLQVLVKLAELGNLRRGAEALGLSQPAVTQLLAELERLLEVPLFDRHSRGVRITPAGQALVPLARRMLDALAEGSETITAMKQAGSGTVRVAAITSGISGLLVRAVPAFTQQHPQVQVHVLESPVDQWPLLLAAREVDLAICREPEVLPAGHVFHRLLHDHFVVACGPGHPLAGREAVRWRRLANELWLPSPVGTTARDQFDRLMAEAQVQPRICQVVTRTPALTWALLRSRRMLTLVPRGVVRQLVEAEQLALIGVEPTLRFRPLGVVLPEQGLSIAASRFVAALQACADAD